MPFIQHWFVNSRLHWMPRGWPPSWLLFSWWSAFEVGAVSVNPPPYAHGNTYHTVDIYVTLHMAISLSHITIFTTNFHHSTSPKLPHEIHVSNITNNVLPNQFKIYCTELRYFWWLLMKYLFRLLCTIWYLCTRMAKGSDHKHFLHYWNMNWLALPLTSIIRLCTYLKFSTQWPPIDVARVWKMKFRNNIYRCVS